MSENVEAAKRAVAALNRGDFEGVGELYRQMPCSKTCGTLLISR